MKLESLSLDDPVWFSMVHFQETNNMSQHINVSLPLLGLAGISTGTEWLFAIVTLSLGILPFILESTYGPVVFVYFYYPMLVLVLLFKRFLFWRKFGAIKRKLCTISAEKIELNALISPQLSDNKIISRQEIDKITVSYLINYDHNTRKTRNSTCNISIKLHDNTNYELDGYRIGLVNVLYLLRFFNYPLRFVKLTTADVMGVLGPLVLKLAPLLANIPAFGKGIFAFNSVFY